MKKASYQILPTKLNQPLLRTDLIIRSGLISKLNDGLNKRLILISAPAGFGKTTLVNSWLAEQKMPVTWFSLDKADNDPSRFYNYLFAALVKVFPNIENNCEGKLNFADSPSCETLLFSLIQEMEEWSNGAIFVLDDYHVIKNPIIHETVQFIIKNMSLINSEPAGGRKGILPVIVSRSDPPFPLSKWRLQNELVEIRMNDLKFSEIDTKAFFRRESGLDISDQQAKAITTQTEGWIAGIQLAAISLREQHSDDLDSFIQGFSGGNHLVADYLVNEVISLLPDNLQNFLINTSILDRMSGPVCDEILGTHDSQAILEELEKSNLFLIPLDEQRIWFRYHHLLSEYLAKRRNQLAKQPIQNMHLHAARWFEKNHYFDESIQHFLAADQTDEAVRIITENASPILNQGKMYYLGELIAYFPEEAFELWPWLCIYRAWKDVIIEHGEEVFWVDKAEQMINKHNHSAYINPQEVDEMLGNIAAIRVMNAAKRGNTRTAYELAPKALTLLPQNTTKVRGLVMNAEGLCQYIDGNLEKAKNTLSQAKSELMNGGNIGGAVDSLGYIGDVLFIQGKLHNAENTYKEALALNKNPNFEFSASFQSCSGLGEVYYEWNRVDDAFAMLNRGYKSSSKMGASARVCTGTALATTYLNLGEFEKAKDILEDLDYLPTSQSVQPHFQSKWAACWIQVYSQTGQYRQAQRLIEERKCNRIDENEFIREPERMALIQFHLATDDPKTGLSLATQLTDSMLSGHRSGRLIKTYLLQALAYQALGDSESAINFLQLALNDGRLEGYKRSFIDCGNPILQMLIELSHTDRTKRSPSFDLSYVQEIIDASLKRNTTYQNHLQNKSIRKSIHLPILDTPLTPQEVGILQLLVAGYDNFEIASNQQISINTVKTHISHIFSKLDVHNRVQASNRAKILGLI
jgi:LuxR family transcriptional regulator, maltose regulon positive regulatory protein